MSKAECIYEWFQDHFDNFECYPMDWLDTREISDKNPRIYDWDECWAILNKNYPDVKWRDVA
jgi:hypothetical protein